MQLYFQLSLFLSIYLKTQELEFLVRAFEQEISHGNKRNAPSFQADGYRFWLPKARPAPLYCLWVHLSCRVFRRGHHRNLGCGLGLRAAPSPGAVARRRGSLSVPVRL